MGDVHHCSGPRNDLYCVEWDVKLYYTIPYHTIDVCSAIVGAMLIVASRTLRDEEKSV